MLHVEEDAFNRANEFLVEGVWVAVPPTPTGTAVRDRAREGIPQGSARRVTATSDPQSHREARSVTSEAGV